MKPLAWGLFDVFALALPRGHGFGDRLPLEIWQSDDNHAFGVVRQHDTSSELSILVARRRVDHVWSLTCDTAGFYDLADARTRLEAELKEGGPLEPIPPGMARRAALHDLGDRPPSATFKLLTAPAIATPAGSSTSFICRCRDPIVTGHPTASPPTFTRAFGKRSCLRPFASRGCSSPTANPSVRYEHINADQTAQPESKEELFFGAASLRFAKTIGRKLQRGYTDLEHVRGHSFALAVADFHAGGSMVWSREPLIAYLTGYGAEVAEIDGKNVAVGIESDELAGGSGFRPGLFRDDRHAELSAIIFTNACTLGKLNRMAISSGASNHGLRYIRYGKFADLTPGSLEGIPFCLDVASEEYCSLWPYGHETWCAELEVFHNPFARHPIADELIPEATHWRLIDGEWLCRSHYPMSILWSRTLILKQTDPIPTYETIPEFLDLLAAHRSQMEDSD